VSSGIMGDFNPNPYRGEASIPHVSEEFFRVYFVGSQVRAPPTIQDVILKLPRALGNEPIRPYDLVTVLRVSGVMQIALGVLMFPGRILGSEMRPRKYK